METFKLVDSRKCISVIDQTNKKSWYGILRRVFNFFTQ